MYLTSLTNHLASKRYNHDLHYLEFVKKKNEMNRESDFVNNMFVRLRKESAGSDFKDFFFPNFINKE